MEELPMELEKWIPSLTLISLGLIFAVLGIYQPWWNIRTSVEAETVLNATARADYGLFQTVAAIRTIGNETLSNFISFGNLTKSQADADASATVFNATFTLVIVGLALSVVALALLMISTRVKPLHRFVSPLLIAAAITLFIAPYYLQGMLPSLTSKLTSVMPVDIPSRWVSIAPANIASFWGSKAIPTSPTFPDWARGGKFWTWGAASGWFLTFVASILLLAGGVSIRSALRSAEMKKEKPRMAFLLSFPGAVLILVNGLMMAFSRTSITLSSGSTEIEKLLAIKAPMWWRIAFGSPSLSESMLMPLWLIFAVVVLFSAFMLYVEPRKCKLYGSSVIFFSILSISMGGGFIIGLILAVIGGGIALEWPKTVGNTFLGRLIGAAKLDSKLYSSVAKEAKALRQAAFIIILVNVLSGLGISLYSFNANKILDSGAYPSVPFKILISGEMFWDFSMLTLPLVFIGIAIIKWIAISGIIYAIGVKIGGAKAEFESIGCAVAFAYVPISLQFFMPFLFMSKPNLAVTWPLTVFVVTNLWMIIALMVAVKQSLDISIGKSIGTLALAGPIYYLLNYYFLQTFQLQNLGSIQFFLEPREWILFFSSLSILLAFLFGVFSRR